MKLYAFFLMLMTLTVWGQNNLKGTPLNSPAKGSFLKIELLPPEDYPIKGIEYVLHTHKGKPVSTPATWVEGKLEESNNKSVAVIPIRLSPGLYKAHIRTTSSEKKGEHRSVMVPFEVTEVKEIPHPGEEGKKTLAGIDSDEDGVRDDVQIWINQKYPTNSDFNKAMKQKAKYDGLLIQHHAEKERALEYRVKSLEAFMCQSYFLSNITEHLNTKREYQEILLNTAERIKAFLTVDSYRHGASMPRLNREEKRNLCEF
jgi:hypothetical protein